MAPRFHPRLVNDPFEDPGLFIAFAHEKRALQFDLGDLGGLSPRDILKISHCFVSHTHMDHFCGFDALLRLCLGRDKQLRLFGPRGFLDNLEGKLRGYNWNLVDRDRYPLELTASEIHDRQMRTRRYDCGKRFQPEADREFRQPFNGILLDEPSLKVEARILDHGIPCLGFCLTEPTHLNIDSVALDRLSLATGAWLKSFKEALHSGRDPATIIKAPAAEPSGGQREFRLGALADRIVRSAPGQKIGYITDVAGHPENLEAIVDLVRGADHLFIESPFRTRDRHLAAAKHHLTADLAGRIAACAGVKRYTLFHFSPRYEGSGKAILADAEHAFAASPPAELPRIE